MPGAYERGTGLTFERDERLPSSRAHQLHLEPRLVTRLVAVLERRQIALYLAAIAAGGALGLLVPGVHHLELAIEPVLALLLFATFLGVPFAAIGRSLRDGCFLGAVGVVNFVIVPLVAFGLSRFVADEPALLFGVLLVLLTPCIDYVIVFAGLAGGASDRLPEQPLPDRESNSLRNRGGIARPMGFAASHDGISGADAEAEA